MPAMLDLSPADLSAAAGELWPRLAGGQLQRAWQPDGETLVLAVHGPAGLVYPVLSCAPGVARLGEASGKPAVPETPPALAQWLRAQALGGVLTGLEAMPGERIVRLTFPGGSLVAELFPRGGALFGLDTAGVVRVATGAGAGRLTLGGPYTPPASAAPVARPARFHAAREIETAAQALLAQHAAEVATVERERLFRAAGQKLERLAENLARDRLNLEDFEAHRRWGELLTAQLHRVQRGASAATVQDWYAEGAPDVEIPLDPRLDGPRNVERLFQRYRKGRDGRARVEARMAEVAAQRAKLEALRSSEPTLDAALAALRKMGLAPRAPQGPGAAQAPRLPYRPFVSRAGERILVGRGGVDNHALTFRVARGNDMWLHVRDAPGAHVVVPQPARGREPHPETLLDAAALAVHHSDLRGEPAAEVTLTQRKHVRAIPGGPPGRVTVAGGRTLTVTDVPARVERLYLAVAQGEVPE